MTQAELASSMGVSPGAIAFVERDERLPSRTFLQKLNAAHGVSADWLLDGTGEMRPTHLPRLLHDMTEISAEEVQRIVEEHYASKRMAQNFRFVRRMELSVSAGSGLVPVDDENADALAFSLDWLKKNAVNADLSVLVSVKGDSMAPQIPDGSLVLVHLPEKRVDHEGVYAFNRGDASFVKRLVPSAVDKSGRPGSIAIISNNPAFPPEVLTGRDLNEIRVVGRVRCVMTTL